MVTDWNSVPPVVQGFPCTGRHFTDDGETTACGAYGLNDLPTGEEIVANPDELVTCPACQAITQLVLRLALADDTDA